ncbi:hypothetical protein F4861DRAFT_538307 [Xylaria intraflava]|nr:hypothetical protein F4861DRAFT_538307 [Xylaria intraflava]
MPAVTKKWDDTMNAHLFLSISYALDLTFTQENKDDIVTLMNQRFGHDVNWNGIRSYSFHITIITSCTFVIIMSGTRNLMNWGGKVHEDILIAMSSVVQPGRGDWDKIMRSLHDMGYTFTESALKQHLQKLKRKETGNTSGTGSAPTTPSKKGKTTPSKAKKRSAPLDEEEDEEDVPKPKGVKKLKLDRQAPDLDLDIKEEPDQSQDGDV